MFCSSVKKFFFGDFKWEIIKKLRNWPILPLITLINLFTYYPCKSLNKKCYIKILGRLRCLILVKCIYTICFHCQLEMSLKHFKYKCEHVVSSDGVTYISHLWFCSQEIRLFKEQSFTLATLFWHKEVINIHIFRIWNSEKLSSTLLVLDFGSKVRAYLQQVPASPFLGKVKTFLWK